MIHLSTNETVNWRLVLVTERMMAKSSYTVQAIAELMSRVLDSILTH